ncbi:MAG: hypothetical protein JWP87_3213 [Labilithrix sp.]|jgi:hypothetical protein|nr:hypothetical protein [Labilithrix sp.]
MKSWRVLLAVPLGTTLAFAVAHCGSDDGATIDETNADSGGDGGTGTEGSTSDGPGSTDGSTDGNPGTDAATDGPGPIPEGGAIADPGKVACGSASCDVATSFCCAVPDGGSSCQTSGGACTVLGGTKQQCNEAADCPAVDAGPQVCCYETDQLGGLTTSCHLDCNGGGGKRYQACRTTNECLSGACAVRTCNSDAGTASIESCKPIPDVCP